MRDPPDWTEDEKKRLMEEEILGIVPAGTRLYDGTRVQCWLVFATNIIIVVFPDVASQMVAGFLGYTMMKNNLEHYEHKKTASILNKFKSYIIPFSAVTMVSFSGTGRIRRRTTLNIHTTEELVYIFNFSESRKTIERDIDQLLHRAGIRVSKGE